MLLKDLRQVADQIKERHSIFGYGEVFFEPQHDKINDEYLNGFYIELITSGEGYDLTKADYMINEYQALTTSKLVAWFEPGINLEKASEVLLREIGMLQELTLLNLSVDSSKIYLDETGAELPRNANIIKIMFSFVMSFSLFQCDESLCIDC